MSVADVLPANTVPVPSCVNGLSDGSLSKSSVDVDQSRPPAASKPSHKILHYGSRHVIQNTGWTTRLTKELPQLKPLQAKGPLLKNDVLPPAAESLKLSLPAIDKCMNVAVQKPTESNGPPATGGAVAQQSAVCFVPMSKPGAIFVGSSSMFNVLPVQEPRSLTRFTVTAGGSKVSVNSSNPLSFGHFAPPNRYCAPGGMQLSHVSVKPSAPLMISNGFSMPTSKSVRTLAVFPSSDGTGCPDIRVLNTQVRIDNGVVTQVNELSTESEVPALPNVSTVDGIPRVKLDNTPASNYQLPVYLTDSNGARFGYYETVDGKRVRIAHDTSGQRYSPFWLIPPKVGPFVYSDVTVEVPGDANKKTANMPTEAEVSAVTTVFTFDPLLISERTLVPVSGCGAVRAPSEPAQAGSDDQYFVYRCYLCTYWSEDQAKLALHWLNVHMPDLQYCCPYCERKFFTNVRAQMHVLHHHPDQQKHMITFRRSAHFAHTLSFELVHEADDQEDDTNSEDSREVITFEQATNHFGRLTDLGYACRKCNYTTRSASELRLHQKSSHVQCKQIPCPYCAAQSNDAALSFASDCDLRQHIRANHPKQLTQAPPPASLATVRSSGQAAEVRADIPWDETWEEIVVATERMLQCRRCAYRAKSEEFIWPHVLREHKWPTTVVCPTCVATITLTDAERRAGISLCASCEASVALGPAGFELHSRNNNLMLVCNVCSYRTPERGSMMRHIRYSHAKSQPYACPYCNYVAVERPRVRGHVTAVHPSEPVYVKEHTETDSEQYRRFVAILFKKLVSVHLLGNATPDGVGVAVASDDSDLDSDVGSSVASSVAIQSSNAARGPSNNFDSFGYVPNDISGEHFQCKICGYCCTDRSCMSRHVKYMHITARPHSCPYCSYNNVEKTKVRLHVTSHHPGHQRSVRTDHKLLEEMSWCAKKFYVRIDQQGNEMIDSIQGARNLPELAMTAAAGNKLNELATTDTARAVSDFDLKTEEMQLDDDVEFEIRPVSQCTTSTAVAVDPVVVLDHNYFALPQQHHSQPEHGQSLSADDMLIAVKQEPDDDGYEDCSTALAAVGIAAAGGIFANSTNTNPGEGFRGSNNETENANVSDGASSSWAESDDDFFSSDLSDESLSLESDHDGNNQFDDLAQFDAKALPDLASVKSEEVDLKETEHEVKLFEPPAKIRKIDPVDDDSTGDNQMPTEREKWDRLKIDENVKKDPKLRMKAVIELEDVIQIILAWQSGALSVEDSEIA